MAKNERKRRDRLFGAAVLKLTFLRRKEEQSPQFRAIFEGVLRDLSVTEAQVDAYLEANRADVEAAIGGGAHGRD